MRCMHVQSLALFIASAPPKPLEIRPSDCIILAPLLLLSSDSLGFPRSLVLSIRSPVLLASIVAQALWAQASARLGVRQGGDFDVPGTCSHGDVQLSVCDLQDGCVRARRQTLSATHCPRLLCQNGSISRTSGWVPSVATVGAISWSCGTIPRLNPG